MRTLPYKATITALALTISLLSFSNRVSASDVVSNPRVALQQAVDMGPVDTSQQITISVHLNKTNQDTFDKTVEALYEPGSPIYEHWLTDDDLRSYAPTPQAVAAVKAELVKHGLTLLSVDPLGFSIRASGTIANAQNAFQTEIHQYSLNNSTFRRLTSPAILTGGADAFVKAVAGLTRTKARPLAMQAVNPKTGKPAPPIALTTAAGAALTAAVWSEATTPADIPATALSSITDVCITAPQTLSLQGYGVTASYYGNAYDHTPGVSCSFGASQLQNHYGLTAAHKAGYTGEGQTIILVEAFGYPTAMADANTFSALYNLPYLYPTNFEVIYPDGQNPDPNAGSDNGWSTEIAIDIQTAHTVAPKAKIIVVATYDQYDVDFLSALLYITNHKLGTTVSNSWELDYESDPYGDPTENGLFNSVLQVAAAKGIAVNFSSGDRGDLGNGSPIGSPMIPSNSPYGTAVGGTSILNVVNGGVHETGWGSVETEIGGYGQANDPPYQFGFYGGGGGGESILNTKPPWQSALEGVGRQVPDISALADPYTGVTIVLTPYVGGPQYFESGWGGTSVACPIVSAFWVLATQYAGHTLGQAAPKIAKATDDQVNDVLPVSTSTNPFGLITDQAGTTYYSPYDLVYLGVIAPNTPSTPFTSALWPNAFSEYQYGADYVLAFGLDTSLTITKGWDNVTGFGAPNGLKFIEGFK